MRYAADVAEAGGVSVVRYKNTAAAAAGIARQLQKEDRILLKGSRGMALEAILEAMRKTPPTPRRVQGARKPRTGGAAACKRKGF
jgi:hypothetical protein